MKRALLSVYLLGTSTKIIYPKIQWLQTLIPAHESMSKLEGSSGLNWAYSSRCGQVQVGLVALFISLGIFYMFQSQQSGG